MCLALSCIKICNLEPVHETHWVTIECNALLHFIAEADPEKLIRCGIGSWEEWEMMEVGNDAWPVFFTRELENCHKQRTCSSIHCSGYHGKWFGKLRKQKVAVPTWKGSVKRAGKLRSAIYQLVFDSAIIIQD